jgi:hypothetical protein
MVLLGGLEIVAAGTLLHRMKQNRRADMHKEAEEDLRRRGWNPDRDSDLQRQELERRNSNLAPPAMPPRPLSVPPAGYVPTGWSLGPSFSLGPREPPYPLGEPTHAYAKDSGYAPPPGPHQDHVYAPPAGPPPSWYASPAPAPAQSMYLTPQPQAPIPYNSLAPPGTHYGGGSLYPKHKHRSRSEEPDRSKQKHRRSRSTSRNRDQHYDRR